ncbi:MAG: NAD-dependent deacylase [Propionibacteriaceae bacterium]|nr:NAD-dependent deacylase [Propionibacteriaceae bacterium]
MSPRIVVLTGAGVSAESGIATFRDANGLWENHRIQDVASPEGFRRNPDLVQRFYDLRRTQAHEVEPNAAHAALARLEKRLPGDVLIVTQNIDDLHERAGSTNVLHIHGKLDSALCAHCGRRTRWTGPLAGRPPCPACGEPALRPDIVWFGENVHHLDEIVRAVRGCELFVVIGTSGAVYPAAGLSWTARMHGATTVLLNLEAQEDGDDFDLIEYGPATRVVPEWVSTVMADLA